MALKEGRKLSDRHTTRFARYGRATLALDWAGLAGDRPSPGGKRFRSGNYIFEEALFTIPGKFRSRMA